MKGKRKTDYLSLNSNFFGKKCENVPEMLYLSWSVILACNLFLQRPKRVLQYAKLNCYQLKILKRRLNYYLNGRYKIKYRSK